MKTWIKSILIFLGIIIILLFIVRANSPREIDDVNPLRKCETDYLKKSDILWIIPNLDNQSISENKTWCKKIQKMNKTLGMHGITHTKNEFNYLVNESELKKGIQIFEECFNQTPTMFKAPYLKLSKENQKILKQNNFEIKGFWNQNFHKVYHCKDSGILPNKFHDLF
ncbi:DUF2334 domain-containing protein [archaeon]|jgi:predicted deacetylase|nr:DUF2334 domain-containing protein [archaeon]